MSLKLILAIVIRGSFWKTPDTLKDLCGCVMLKTAEVNLFQERWQS